jgi:antitoxin component of RelBE/YafQ-DinJ toxin-antitoxin module
MAKVNIRVTDEIKAKFKAKADSQNLSESDCFRQWVLGDESISLIDLPKGEQKLKPVTVRLPETIIERLKPIAESRGMKVSRWVSALVQAHIIAEPVLTKAELRAVYEATVQLTKAGTNLNQVAKSLNEHFYPGDPVILKAIKSVSNEVKELKQRIKELQIASSSSWR